MTNLNTAVKRALVAIGTGTAASTATAAAIGTSVLPTLSMGTGAVMGIALVLAYHTHRA